MSDRLAERLLGHAAADAGCERCAELLDQYAEAALRGEDPARQFPEVATHLRNCADCREDSEGLLAYLRQADESPGPGR